MAQGMFNHLINIVYKSIGAGKAVTDAKKVRQMTSVPWDTKAVKKYERNVRKAFGAVEQGKKPIKGATTGMKDFSKAMRRALIVAPVWMALRGAMMAVVATIKAGVKFLIDWEYQMAQLRIVGKGTAAEYKALSDSLLRLASAFGVANAQMGEAAKLWIQQGKAISEIPSLMEATIKLSMLSGRTMTQSVEDLTAVMKSYNITAEESGSIIDKVTKTMLNHAITTDTLVSALKLAAPVAEQFNVSFEKMLGIITASHIATRLTGSRIGRAWSTIFIRMGTSAKKGIQEIAKVPVYINEVGEATFEQTTELRNFGDVLDEIAIKYKTLSGTQRANLANLIAGKRRAIAYIGAMKSWEEGIRTTIDALNSFGEGNKAVNILLDTAKTKTQQLGGAWNEFIISLFGGAAGLKATLGGLADFVTGLTKVSYYMKGIGFGKFYEDVRATADEFKKSSDAISEEIQRINTMIGLSKQFISLAETRNRIELEGGENAEEALKTYDKYLKLIRESIAKQEGMSEIMTMPVKDAIEFFKSKESEFENMILSERAKSNILQRNKKLIDEMTALWDEYLAKSKVFLGGFIRPGLPKGITPQQADIEDLEALSARLKKQQTSWILRPGELKGLKIATETVNQIIKIKKQGIVLSDESIAKEIKFLKIEKEVLKAATISTQQFKDRITEYKSLTKLGYADLEINKLILDYIEKYREEFEKIDEDLIGRLDLQNKLLKIQKDYNRGLDAQSLILDSMKAQGYTQLQIETQRLAMMEKQNIGEQALYNQKLKIKKAAIDIYESEKKRFTDMYVQYEKADAFERKRIERFLELSKMSPQELARAYEYDMFDKRIIEDYWGSFTDLGKAAIGEIIRELYDLPVAELKAGVTGLAQQRGFGKSLAAGGLAPGTISIPPANISLAANVGNIIVTIPEGSLENMARSVGNKVVERLLTEEELKKLFASKIRPYM